MKPIGKTNHAELLGLGLGEPQNHQMNHWQFLKAILSHQKYTANSHFLLRA